MGQRALAFVVLFALTATQVSAAICAFSCELRHGANEATEHHACHETSTPAARLVPADQCNDHSEAQTVTSTSSIGSSTLVIATATIRVPVDARVLTVGAVSPNPGPPPQSSRSILRI